VAVGVWTHTAPLTWPEYTDRHTAFNITPSEPLNVPRFSLDYMAPYKLFADLLRPSYLLTYCIIADSASARQPIVKPSQSTHTHHLHLFLLLHYYILLESWYGFYHHTKGRRLHQDRQCMRLRVAYAYKAMAAVINTINRLS